MNRRSPLAQWSDSEVRLHLRHVRMRTWESSTTSNSMILVPFEPEVRVRTRDTMCANFGLGALSSEDSLLFPSRLLRKLEDSALFAPDFPKRPRFTHAQWAASGEDAQREAFA